jgi:hypothetical protein
MSARNNSRGRAFLRLGIRALRNLMRGMSQGHSFCVHLLNPSLHFDIGQKPVLVFHTPPEGEH